MSHRDLGDGIPQLKLPRETIASLCSGNHGRTLPLLAAQARRAAPEVRRFVHQVRARVWLDIGPLEKQTTSALYPEIAENGKVDGPSTPLFAELMVDLALLLHCQGDAPTAVALLRKLLAWEWAALDVNPIEWGGPSAKPTRKRAVDHFIHQFLAPSNVSPPLPPESRARALRIFATVLLAREHYKDAENVALHAHELALQASEIARCEVWRALALCGQTRAAQGRLVEGKTDLQRAIELATVDYGPRHPEVRQLGLDLARIQAFAPNAIP